MRVLSQALAGITLLTLAALPCYGQQGTQSSTGNSSTTEQATNDVATLEDQARQAIQTFKQNDATLEKFFRDSAGYAVFPTVGEGALIVGAGHGKGIVYQNGQPIGEATVTKGSVGAQIGGQSFSEVVFFQSPDSLRQFEQGNFEFSASINAVAASSGVGSATNYRNGVAVFTTGRAGLMAKAAIGGQKFTYQPLAMGGAGLGGQTGTGFGTSSNNIAPIGR